MTRVSVDDIFLVRLVDDKDTAQLVLNLLTEQPPSHFETWASEKLDVNSIVRMLNDNEIFGIFLSRTLVGIIGLDWDEEDRYRAWIHYLVDKNYTGRGIASVAVRSLLSSYNFFPEGEEGTEVAIDATVDKGNSASEHVLRNAGFKLIESDPIIYEKRISESSTSFDSSTTFSSDQYDTPSA